MKYSPLVLLIVGSLSTCLPAGDSWPQWRGARRDGVAHDSPPLLSKLPSAGLKPLWIARSLEHAQSAGWSSPAVVDGRVYLFSHKRYRRTKGKLPKLKFPYLAPEKRVGMSDEEYAQYERDRRDEQQARALSYRFQETLYCLSAADGREIWKSQSDSVYTRFSQSGTPTVIDGRIFVLGAGRIARCLDAKGGKEIWRRELPGEFRDEYLQSSFLVVDGVAAVVCGQLFGLDAADGRILWRMGEPRAGSLHGSPTVWRDGDRAVLIAGFDGKHTVGIDAASGERLWRVRSDAGHSSPVVVGDRLLTYGNSRKKGLRCFQLAAGKTPEQLWVYQGAADPGSSPVAWQGHVYVQGDRRLACVNLTTGKAEWMTRLDLNRPRYTSLAAADGKVFYTFDGVLCFDANPKKYQPLMQAKIDKDGLLADEQQFRKLMGMDKLETTAEGQREAEKLWRDRFGRSGPLPCASPALVNGRLYLRLQDGIACYDLNEKKK